VAELYEAEDGPTWADLDLDNDMVELGRAKGPKLLADLAEVLLGPDPDLGERARAALAPELEGDPGPWFLRLVGVNLAFRLRTDALLAALLRFAHAGDQALTVEPARVGALLARARSLREARALIEASPLNGEARDAALEALTPGELRLDGARLHLEGDHEQVGEALARVLRPWTRLPWTQAVSKPEARRFLLLRRRGGWTTVLEEGPSGPDLAKALAAAGIRRAVWARFGAEAPADLAVFEGSRRTLDRATLAERCGEDPEDDDVAGALRALGVLDLDPEHPRGPTILGFAAALEHGPKRRSSQMLAFAP
jgi:hypothetical protein